MQFLGYFDSLCYKLWNGDGYVDGCGVIFDLRICKLKFDFLCKPILEYGHGIFLDGLDENVEQHLWFKIDNFTEVFLVFHLKESQNGLRMSNMWCTKIATYIGLSWLCKSDTNETIHV